MIPIQPRSVAWCIAFAVACGLLFFTAEGCTENCGDIVCAPAPPMLVVTVLDSVDLGDTVLYQRPVDAVVTLYVDAGASLQNPILLDFDPFDTTYVRYTGLQEGAEIFAVVADRGAKSDTLRNLTLKRSEGCCGVTTIGWFTIRM